MQGLNGINRSRLEEYLESLGDAPLCFKPNPGNAGDSTLTHATFQLLHKLGKHFRLFGRRSYRPGRSILVYAGGGNLTYYDHARKFILKHHRSAQRLVILPHTICHNEPLLGELGSNVDLICREEISFDHVRKHARRANVLLMEDVAFHLDVRDTLDTDTDRLLPKLLSRHLLETPLRNAGRLLLSVTARGHRQAANEDGGILNCFRTDIEKSSIEIPRDNIDLSVRFAFGTHDEAVCRYASALVFRFINRFDEIRTNRLHIAIAGALLGKKVRFHSNSYYKCKAVYDYSMKHRFPNVEWMG